MRGTEGEHGHTDKDPAARHAARADLEQDPAVCAAGGGHGDPRAAVQCGGYRYCRQFYGRTQHGGGRGRGSEQSDYQPDRQPVHRHRAGRECYHRSRHRRGGRGVCAQNGAHVNRCVGRGRRGCRGARRAGCRAVAGTAARAGGRDAAGAGISAHLLCGAAGHSAL